MDIEKALAIPGWSSREELEFLAVSAHDSKVIIEIGSWRGRSARAMADNTDGIVYCVDTWADDAYGNPGWWTEYDALDLHKRAGWLQTEFRKNLAGYYGIQVCPIRSHSVQAAELLKSHGTKADMIYIDAGHRYEDVVADIKAWRPLLAEGGTFMGHDYCVHSHPEVVRAVDELVGKVDVIDTIWVAR